MVAGGVAVCARFVISSSVLSYAQLCSLEGKRSLSAIHTWSQIAKSDNRDEHQVSPKHGVEFPAAPPAGVL